MLLLFDEAKLGSYEYIFNSLQTPMFLFDYRNIKKVAGKNDWLFEKMNLRGQPKSTYPQELFDAIVFIQ